MRFLFPKMIVATCLVMLTASAFAGVTFSAPAKKPAAPVALAKPTAIAPMNTPPAVVAPLKPPAQVVTPVKAPAAPVKATPSVDGAITPPKEKASSSVRKTAAKAAPVVVSQASLDYMREITAALAAGIAK